MVMTVSYAETQGGIGLTASGAMNRKFVHWAAAHFDWPGYTSDDLYSINKVLNEADMPPLLVVRDMLKHLRLLRRRKDVLVPTQRGRDFLARPQAFFDLIATDIFMPISSTGRRRRLSVIGYVGGTSFSILSV